MVIVFHPSYTIRARAIQACGRVGRAVVALETLATLREFLRINRAGAILMDGTDPGAAGLVRELRSNPATATVPILWIGSSPENVEETEDKILAEPDVYLPLDEFDMRLEIELQRIFLPVHEPLAGEEIIEAPMHILLIDDSLTYRMQLRDALIAGGYHVALAETGEEGLELASRNNFAAVLVDNMLPGIQGSTVIRRLRSKGATRRIPCILLTASEDPENELDALDAGADTFVRKDEPPETILLRLAAILRTTSAPSAFQFASTLMRRVLIVGPRGDETTGLREALLTDGVVLVEEPDPDAVLARALRDGFDAIVITLPHVEALHLCRRLKQTPQLGMTRVLLMECLIDTDHEVGTLAERQISALQAGADDYLTCSLPVRNLRARLETQLRRKQMEDENRALHDHILRQQIEADSQRRLATARTEHAEELRRAKEAVELEAREAEGARSRLEQVMEALPQMVLMASGTGELITYNRRWPQYTGDHPYHFTPAMWKAVMPPDDLERYLNEREQALKTGIGFAGEFRIRSAEGEYRWFYIQVIPMRSGISWPNEHESEEARWLCTCTDIHNRKMAEEALRRTEKLAATGRLAASIAHEINNPLEAVTNLLFLAENGTREQGDVHGYVLAAQQEIARVSEIAKKTLAFYRESKNPAPVDLQRLVEETRDVYGSRMRQKRIEFTLDARTDIKPNGLAGELRQVLSNLIANAIDASPIGGALYVRIHAAMDVKTGRRGVRLSVADRGEGIPERLREELFKPFVTTKGQSGTGLGLWVAASIAARHEGALRFWSSTRAPHNGTVFSFFLPADGRVKIAEDSIGEMMKQIGSELLQD